MNENLNIKILRPKTSITIQNKNSSRRESITSRSKIGRASCRERVSDPV